jgi:hypothetical protein
VARAAPTIDELMIADDADAWRSAGFAVDDCSTSRIGAVRVRLDGRGEGGKGIRSWAVNGVDGDREVDGLATTAGTGGPASPGRHPNGSLLIDHVVVATPDMDRTVAALGGLGLEPRRERRAGTYGTPMRQVFFRMGEVILEVIGPEEPQGDRPARFFGIAVTVDDLDATKELLGERLGQPKDAVQPGRRIATLRHKELGLTTAVAFMSAGQQEYG